MDTKSVFQSSNNTKVNQNRKAVTTCKGSNAGYIDTSGCVLSAALALIRDRDTLPNEGGIYTTAAAFEDSSNVMDHALRHILLYDRLIALIVLPLLYLASKFDFCRDWFSL